MTLLLLVAYDPEVATACEAGCAAHEEYDVSAVVPQPGAKAGDLTRCPVSGVVLEVQADQPNVTVEGDLWYTCCPGCAGILSVDQSKFVRRS